MSRKAKKQDAPQADYSAPPAEWVEPAELVPWPGNPKKPTRKRIDQLAAIIRELGFGPPIIARPTDNMIACGHTRWMAAKKIGLAMVPVRFMPLDDEQLAAMAIADNRLGEDQPWLQDNLREELMKLDLRFDPLMLGFDEKEIERLLGRSALPPVPMSDDDLPFDAPSLDDGASLAPGSATIEVKPGELWTVGPHRLLCDDSKKRENIKRLFGKERADLMFTDPPYGVDFKQADSAKNVILGDLSQAEFPVSLDAAIQLALSKDARIYICGGSSNFAMVVSLFDHHLRMWPHVIVWVKENFVLRRNGYHSRYEFIYHGWLGKGGAPEFWYGDRTSDDVWEERRIGSSDKIHPTEKPPELSQRALRNHCRPNGIVYDPFWGSGSTAIGAHREGRVCYGMERDPKFAKASLERLSAELGVTPERTNHG